MESHNIHNIMEEKVLQVVDQVCEEDQKSANPRYCVTPYCRTDAACYVLNRIPQRYISSSRGLAHTDSELSGDFQMQIDVVTLVHEALERVTRVRRCDYSGSQTEPVVTDGCFLNPPTIAGRLIDGTTFAPLADIPVTLRENGAGVAMVDQRWANPYLIAEGTSGTFLFRPQPIPASAADEHRVLEYEILIDRPEYDGFRHFFSVEVHAEPVHGQLKKHAEEFRIPDLFVIAQP